MATKTKKGIEYEIPILEGVDLTIEGNTLTAKGEKGTVTKSLAHPLVTIAKKETQILLAAKGETKKNKRIINTFRAHILALMRGAKEGFTYNLKICSGHFPMTIKKEGEKVIITNFLGEKVPRAATIVGNVKVDIGKDTITVVGANREDAGQTAANLEVATIIRNRDKRIFQDGIYITKKPGRVAQ